MKLSLNQEKRGEGRSQVNETEKAFVELTLTYPKEHKICKPIIDFSSSGVSFSIPLDEGFLLPGTPIKKISIHTKNEFKTNLSGEVRYLMRTVDLEGKPFTRVGLKLNFDKNLKLMVKRDGKYQLRPQRYCDDQFQKWVQIPMPNQADGTIQGRILNFSEFGLAFEIENFSDSLRNSEVLAKTKVFVENELVYDGSIIIKSIRKSKNKLIIGASVMDQLVNINKVFQIRTKVSLADEFNEFLKDKDFSSTIKQEFKSIIAEMRLFLENVKSWFVHKENSRSNHDQFSTRYIEEDILIMQAVSSRFAQILDRYHRQMYDIVSSVDESSRDIYKHFYQKQLHDLLLISPIVKRVYLKPCGYAGDFGTISMLLGEPYIGDNLYAKLISWYIWQMPTAQGVRYRLKYLTGKIREQVRVSQAKSASELKVLSVGSGPAKEIQDLISTYTEANHCNVTLIDFDPEALLYSQQKLFEAKILYKSSIELNFINRAVINLLCDGKNPLPNQDLIYCVGLFDYLTDDTCSKLLKILYRSLNPGGLLVASNLHVSNTFSTFMEFAGEWYIIHRSEEEMLNLFACDDSVERKWVELEDSNTDVYLLIKRKS